MKRFVCIVLSVVIFATLFCGCETGENESKEGITVITTLFPQYDFARHILGEYGNVELLLPLGAESHTYEPRPADIIAIENCDLFIYTGKDTEPNIANLLQGASDNVNVCEAAAGIELDMTGDSHGHEYVYDPHVWTTPNNAIKMVENICNALIEIDARHEAEFRANAESYISELKVLDKNIRTVVENADKNLMIFAGRFALHYFVKEYGLEYISAFDSCSHETEPSASAVKEIIDALKREEIEVVFCEELVDQRIANTIADEADAKVLVFHSCHNVSKEDFDSGVTYLDLMRQNLENLEEGLK